MVLSSCACSSRMCTREGEEAFKAVNNVDARKFSLPSYRRDGESGDIVAPESLIV